MAQVSSTTGARINTYSNDDVMAFARVWTGWEAQDVRGKRLEGVGELKSSGANVCGSAGFTAHACASQGVCAANQTKSITDLMRRGCFLSLGRVWPGSLCVDGRGPGITTTVTTTNACYYCHHTTTQHTPPHYHATHTHEQVRANVQQQDPVWDSNMVDPMRLVPLNR